MRRLILALALACGEAPEPELQGYYVCPSSWTGDREHPEAGDFPCAWERGRPPVLGVRFYYRDHRGLHPY